MIIPIDGFIVLFMVFHFPVLLAHSLSEPNKYQYKPASIQNTIYALKTLKRIASLYAGYQVYKLVRSKKAPVNNQ